MKTTHPLVSVIITNYNYAQYIGQAISSVFSQTYPNLELIVINDGSTDMSHEVIVEALKQAPENLGTEYIVQDNQGICVTRNYGLGLVAGKYFCFLDADDYFNPDYIEKSVAIAEEFGADIVYPNWHVFGDKEYWTDFDEFDLQLLIQQKIHCTAESLVRMSSVEDHTFKDLDVAEDWDFFIGLALAGKYFKLAKDNFINYRVRQGTRGSRRGKKSDLYTFCDILVKWHRLYPDKVNPFDLPVTLATDRLDHISVLDEIINELSNKMLLMDKEILDLKALVNSSSYRLGRKLTAPYRYIKRLIN